MPSTKLLARLIAAAATSLVIAGWAAVAADAEPGGPVRSSWLEPSAPPLAPCGCR